MKYFKFEIKDGGKKVRNNCPGLSFNLCFGTEFSMPQIYISNMSSRICLGWVALNVFFYDEEVATSGYIKMLKKEIEELKGAL